MTGCRCPKAPSLEADHEAVEYTYAGFQRLQGDEPFKTYGRKFAITPPGDHQTTTWVPCSASRARSAPPPSAASTIMVYAILTGNQVMATTARPCSTPTTTTSRVLSRSLSSTSLGVRPYGHAHAGGPPRALS